MSKINVAIADDHPPVINGLTFLLELEQTITISHKAKNGQELISVIEQSKIKPDVILMDIEMPVMNGYEAAGYLALHYPSIKIIFLSNYNSRLYIEKAIECEPSGFLSKFCDHETIVQVISNVHHGIFYENEYFNQSLVNDFIKNNQSFELLTKTEKQFVKLVCKEKTSEEICKEMNIKSDTIETYQKRIKSKIGIETIGEIKFFFQKR